VARSYWIETLGCPKNQVDSEKLAGTIEAEGCMRAASPEVADLVVVNTCAFVEAAREESLEVIFSLDQARKPGARLVVTGCMAERYGDELAGLLPEVDLVAGFGVPVTGIAPARSSAPSASCEPATSCAPATGRAPATSCASGSPALGQDSWKATAAPVAMVRPPSLDLLNLPRPPSSAPWAYLKIAEGCDRNCGFCAIPSFRGRQRSREVASILAEVEALGDRVKELVLVAQDLASFGLDRSDTDFRPPRSFRPAAKKRDERPIVSLVRRLLREVDRVRLLYLYPAALDDALIEVVLESGVPYFDLSLQHVSRPLLKRMRRFGSYEVFMERIRRIRAMEPDAAFRSSFILGYPGETEDDHDLLLDFIAEAELDWAGFFPFSEESGTYAAKLDGKVPEELAMERLRECSELQDQITAARRDALVGTRARVLVDSPGVARSHREAPEIDGVVIVPRALSPGTFADVEIVGSTGTDLLAEAVGAPVTGGRLSATG
jgi:ribosomal protein S12 methylthiotransferase